MSSQNTASPPRQSGTHSLCLHICLTVFLVTYRDGSRTRHVVHECQLSEAALVVVAADLLRFRAVVHFHVNTVLPAVKQTGQGERGPAVPTSACACPTAHGVAPDSAVLGGRICREEH